jgi:putative addiction module component (TIGR02574 family)
MMDSSIIELEALHLPPAERAKLAHSLLLSLENLSDAELQEAWLDEAQSRADEIDEGLVELISAEEVSAKARLLLK